jgi:hypothetical protein
MDYSLNNIDSKVLKVLQINQKDIDNIMLLYDENKNKKITTDAQANFLKEIIDTIQEKGKDSPLYKNSKEQEQQIIKAFLDSEVVNV